MLHKIIDKFSYLIEERTAAARRGSLGQPGDAAVTVWGVVGCCINNAVVSEMSVRVCVRVIYSRTQLRMK